MIFMANIYFDIETNNLLDKLPEARITCIGCLHSDFGVRIFSAGDEQTILSNFALWDQVDWENDIFVSFNGIGFDVPFLLAKCQEYNYQGLEDKLMDIKHVDLLKVIYPHYAELVAPTPTGRISKVYALNFFNIYEPRVGSAFNCLLVADTSKDWSEIWLHNAMDLFSTKKLFDRCHELGWC